MHPCRNPSKVHAVSLAIRKVEPVSQLMVLVFNPQHLEQIHIGRTCTYKTVNTGITLQQVIDKQRVGSRNITMYSIIVNSISVCVIIETVSDSHLTVEHPCIRVVCLDGRLHQQGRTQHVANVTIQTLYIFGSIRQCHIVLVRMRIYNAGLELDELGIHRIVHTCSETFEVRTGTFQRSLLAIVVQTYIIGIMGTASRKVYIMVLTNTCLEYFIKPVCIRIIHEMIFSGCTIKHIA